MKIEIPELPDLSGLEKLNQYPPIKVMAGEKVIAQMDSMLIPKVVTREIFNLLRALMIFAEMSMEGTGEALELALPYCVGEELKDLQATLAQLREASAIMAKARPEEAAQ